MIIAQSYGLTLEEDLSTKKRSVYINFKDASGEIIAKCKMSKDNAKNFIEDIQNAYYAALTHNEAQQ